MKLATQETLHQIDGAGAVLSVYFEPLARAGQYWRENYGRTHSQAFRFEIGGRRYWGEIIRSFDRKAASGERVSIDVELRTDAGKYSRAIPENQRIGWRAGLVRQFKRDLAAYVESQGANPEPVPAGPEVAPAASAEPQPAKVSVAMTWAAAAQIIGVVLTNGTAEGRRMAQDELARMAALADSVAVLREALLNLATVANETAHCVGEPGEMARDEMDSAILAVYQAAGTCGLVTRVTVTDSESAYGDSVVKVALETDDGPAGSYQLFPRYPEASERAGQLAARYRVDVYDSTAEGRAALAAKS